MLVKEDRLNALSMKRVKRGRQLTLGCRFPTYFCCMEREDQVKTWIKVRFLHLSWRLASTLFSHNLILCLHYRSDSSFRFFVFFFVYICQFGVHVLQTIGITGWGTWWELFAFADSVPLQVCSEVHSPSHHFLPPAVGSQPWLVWTPVSQWASSCYWLQLCSLRCLWAHSSCLKR